MDQIRSSKVLLIGARWSHSLSLSLSLCIGKNGHGSRFTADQSQFVTGRRYETTRFGPPLFSIFHLFVIKLQSIRLSPRTRNREKQCIHPSPLAHPPTPAKGNYIFITSSGKRYWGRSTSESVNLRAISARSTFSTSSNSFFAAGVHRNENQVCKLIRRFQIYRLFLFPFLFLFYSRFLRFVKRRKSWLE